MITVTLYSRSDCHLCDQAEQDLKSLQEEIPHRLVVLDVDSDKDLKRRYGFEVPVVEVGPYRLSAPFDRKQLEMTLRAAVDRQSHLQRIDDKSHQAAVARGQRISRADRFSYWLSRHYLLVCNLVLLLYVGLPFLAPVLKKAGAEGAAQIFYKIYAPLCHQWGFRSWYLFGNQAYYPHAAAGIAGVLTFEAVSGITDQEDPARVAARMYQGDEEVGFKIPLCQRDLAIWGSLLLFGLVFAVTDRRIPPLHWAVWILVGLLPIALDGFSQLFSQLPVEGLQMLLPYRESTPLLRTITGCLFGFTTAWFGFPQMEAVMSETRRLYMKKFALLSGK